MWTEFSDINKTKATIFHPVKNAHRFIVPVVICHQNKLFSLLLVQNKDEHFSLNHITKKEHIFKEAVSNPVLYKSDHWCKFQLVLRSGFLTYLLSSFLKVKLYLSLIRVEKLVQVICFVWHHFGYMLN